MDDLTVIPDIRPLNADEQTALDQGLRLASRLTNSSHPIDPQYLQNLYNSLLETAVENDLNVIALGLGFGQELLSHGDYEWVRVSNEYGDETCIAVRGLFVYCSPISIIQKRLHRGERPDFVGLRDAVIAAMNEKVAAGNAGERSVSEMTK